VNDGHAEGIASSLRCGLRACAPHARAVAVLLGDQPTVTSTLIDAVVGAWMRTCAPFVRPVFCAGNDRTPGHPVVIARSEWPEVERLRGDEGARVLLAGAHAAGRVHEVRIDAPAPPDVDTVNDYERVRQASLSGVR
jgi:molybdenum cofactor cytidylyltransferase